MTTTDEVGIPTGGTGRTLAGLAVDRLVRPVWYALVAYGSMWLGGVDFADDGTPVPRWPVGADVLDHAPDGLRAS
ncbi:hypothetical protein GTW43_22360 [Streptomyces sp. SID5785]|uniref:hypothetical protein n=1 Tax=Streptomyces sp. SID5785 TaxID=2690309 RepID=UPI001360FD49|nr:hypothetical protein [Streptomyces sp. SID5785]MZD07803.1 hypothetical protein [Streptomyces sp. SID5785]